MSQLEFIRQQINESAATKERMLEECISDIESAGNLLINAIGDGKKILWCGNGGSAADSQHLSAELVGKLRKLRSPVASLALTVDTSFLTAWANDVDYDTIFSRQVEALGQAGDVLVGISTSGNSPNVLAALETAGKMGLKTIVLTGGSGGKMLSAGNVVINIPGVDTQRVQEGHILTGHILCDLVEQSVLEASK